MDIPDSTPPNLIQLEEVAFRYGIPSQFFKKIGGYLNLMLHQVNLSTVGSVKSAMLDETQFQLQMGSIWVLADGRDVTGSSYATLTGNTVIPDLRGMVLVGANHGRLPPYAGYTPGVQLPDTVFNHTHPVTPIFGNAAKIADVGSVQVGGGTFPVVNFPAATINVLPGGVNGTDVFGRETCARTITVNHFIKIN